jgi:hypothetical protein
MVCSLIVFVYVSILIYFSPLFSNFPFYSPSFLFTFQEGLFLTGKKPVVMKYGFMTGALLKHKNEIEW